MGVNVSKSMACGASKLAPGKRSVAEPTPKCQRSGSPQRYPAAAKILSPAPSKNCFLLTRESSKSPIKPASCAASIVAAAALMGLAAQAASPDDARGRWMTSEKDGEYEFVPRPSLGAPG